VRFRAFATACAVVGFFGGILSLAGALKAQGARETSALALAALTLPLAGALSGWLREQAELRTAALQGLRNLRVRTRAGGMWGFRVGEDGLWVSDDLGRLLGLEPGELPSTLDGLFARVHPEDLRRTRDALDAVHGEPNAQVDFIHRLRRGDGSWVFLRTRATAHRERTGFEVTAFSEEATPALESAAPPWFTDALTGLPNKPLFLDRLKQAVSRRKRPPLSPLALLRVQLDPGELPVQELAGRVGDEIVVRISERLEGAVRQGDTVARLSDWEFGIVLERVQNDAELERFCDQIARAVAAPIWLCEKELRFCANIGAVLAPNGLTSPDALFRQAEAARELAARAPSGERRVLIDALGPSEWGSRLPFDTLLRQALGHGDLEVHYQPIVELAERRIVGFEALLRWQNPSLGPLLPSEIVAGAEDAGLIDELEDFVLEQACTTLAALRRRANVPLYVAVNVSTQDLEMGTLAARVERALARAELPPGALALELKESALMDETRVTQASLDKLRALGVRLHMDDFGTGYSSLSYLHQVSLDALKIDASCVRELCAGDDEIVRTAVALGRALGLRVMAEGVESEAELEALAHLGCSEAQGYFFGAPLPSHELEALLRRGDRFETGSSIS
jgi:diguanylate cyclase (GGDEF)-like protein